MKLFKITVLLILIISNFSYAENPSYEIFKNDTTYNLGKKHYILGASMLATEYVVVPIMMKNVWWEDGWELKNPFGKEDNEPYVVDEGWHAAMTYLMQDGHYTILRRFFNVKSPYPSMGLTFFSWTFIEIFDSMAKGDKWSFSVNDEIGNIAGIMNWYVHHKYPKFKFYIRGGMRTWSDFDDYIVNSHEFFTDKEAYAKKYGHDKYSISKVEYIYKWYDEFYSGVAVSRYKETDGNVWGYTMGWDAISFANKRTKGWWNYPTRLFSNSFSLSLSFTIWNKKPMLTFF